MNKIITLLKDFFGYNKLGRLEKKYPDMNWPVINKAFDLL